MRFGAAFLPLILAGAAAAHEPGTAVTFGGLPVDLSKSVCENVCDGGALWESGPSDPAKSDFPFVLLQGRTSLLDMTFQASVRAPGGAWSPWTTAELQLYPGGR